MGRRSPLDNNIILIHPFLHLSFFLASFVATIAITTAICSVRFLRKSQPNPPQAQPLDISKDSNETSPSSISPLHGRGHEHEHEHEHEKSPPVEQRRETENNEFLIKELPLPPAMLQPKESFSYNNMKRVTSERKTSFSLSMKMPTLPRNLSLAKNWDQIKEDINKAKPKTEESVWMKTIILGDKCVPDDEHDPVIFEGKGKKISAYHPKSYSTISRQCSFLDPDALCVSQSQTQEDRINSNK
ncbi:unnamed protein product [Vicia faba]|uniref:Transmembrane protein n=1 Tax=Vicia faba TaxID=3906 RepID=A0AAV0ZQP3_VICFA|nr:unnamed protein product [Vicia faba]